MAKSELAAPRRINTIEGGKRDLAMYPIATGSLKKLAEFDALGLRLQRVLDIKPTEIQIDNGTSEEILEAKAIDAYRLYGGPIIVEDTSFSFDAWGGRPGPYTKAFLTDRADRKNFVDQLPSDDRGATMRVGLAIFDGENVQTRIGSTRGTVVPPRSSADFGFDDIFISEEEHRAAKKEKRPEKTYAEMTSDEKNQSSPRAKAVRELLENPFEVGGEVFQIPEPLLAQLSLRRPEELPTSESALRYAFGLESLMNVEPNPDFKIDVEKYLRPLHKRVYGATEENPDGIVWEFTPNPDSASQGIVVVPFIDLREEPDPHRPGELKSLRLDVDIDGNPIFGQFGPRRLEMALAARAREFKEMHSNEMHDSIRKLASGEIPHVPRSNTRSPVLEEMIEMVKSHTDERGTDIYNPSKQAITTRELGYKRQSHDEKLSRKTAATFGTMLLGPDGVPTNLFALGGMPPITGSMDEIVTAAMSYMKSWIPHNGVFAGNFDRQLQLFEQSRDKIKSFGLPKDIEEICIKQVGISVGSDNPEVIADQIRRFKESGGHAARIYTTNPDVRIVETAKTIREAGGEDFLICVGPVTDGKHARELKEKANVQMFLIGHGGGENCTSLSAGGAANSIEILYDLYTDPFFNDTHIGVEGGTGETIGALLPMLDVISLNRRGVGGIEPSQGIYLRKTSNGRLRYVQPYHGSASAVTQIIEATMDPEIAKRRLGPDGKVRNVEGKPNYTDLEAKIDSSVDQYAKARTGAGLALADQRSRSIYEIRKQVREKGHNHVEVTPSSSEIAGAHRPAA